MMTMRKQKVKPIKTNKIMGAINTTDFKEYGKAEQENAQQVNNHETKKED